MVSVPVPPSVRKLAKFLSLASCHMPQTLGKRYEQDGQLRRREPVPWLPTSEVVREVTERTCGGRGDFSVTGGDRRPVSGRRRIFLQHKKRGVTAENLVRALFCGCARIRTDTGAALSVIVDAGISHACGLDDGFRGPPILHRRQGGVRRPEAETKNRAFKRVGVSGFHHVFFGGRRFDADMPMQDT